MAARLKSLRIRNYRSLADVSLDLGPINVLFGPSGAGKSSLLDAIGFVCDCVKHGVGIASAKRGQGLGLLSDGAGTSDRIQLDLATDRVGYELTLGLTAGRIDPLAGERLYWLDRRIPLFERRIGAAQASLFDAETNQGVSLDLRDPGKLVLDRYLDFDRRFLNSEAIDLVEILLTGEVYHSRSLNLNHLKTFGSSTGIESRLTEQGENLWSILRTFESRRLLDDRYATVMKYMAEAFPTFKGLVIEPTAPTVLYASFVEIGKQKPILASGISDGHLQFLVLLTGLFIENPGVSPLVMFDEPETSLHPWALAVLAKAIWEATRTWGRQVILATHSPVLISQFEPDRLLAVESSQGRTRITRVSEIENIQDLLQEYATGSLYMSEAVAPQSMIAEPSASGR